MIPQKRVRRAAFAALVVLLAGCSSLPASAPTTSTTTTTTLPQPNFIVGSNPADSLASIGPIWRIRVPILGRDKDAPAPPPAVTIPSSQLGAERIGYRQFGAGPDLLLIMGEHGSMTWWDPQLLSDLAGHFRVTIFDLPGVGYSAAVRPIELARYADVTAGFVYAMGLKTPMVLGWGLGGEIALSLAERHPDLISRLILVDTSAGGVTSTPPTRAVQTLLASPDANTIALSQLFFPRAALGARTGWLSRISQVVPDDVVASSIASEAKLQGAVYTKASLFRDLRSIRAPALVVVGALDEVVPPRNGELLAHLLVHAQLHVFADAGYADLFQDEPAFFSQVLAFVSH